MVDVDSCLIISIIFVIAYLFDDYIQREHDLSTVVKSGNKYMLVPHIKRLILPNISSFRAFVSSLHAASSLQVVDV
jgi:hypothetical protein